MFRTKIYLLILSLSSFFSCSEGKIQLNNDAAALEEMLFESNLESIKTVKVHRFHFKKMLSETIPETALLRSKIRITLNQMDSIDAKTASIIQKIDHIKLQLLKQNGEKIDFQSSNLNNENKIVWSQTDRKNPLLPIRLNLNPIASDQYPDQFELLDENSELTQKGIIFWKELLQYRSDLVDLVGTYTIHDQHYDLKTTQINHFENQKELLMKVRKMISESNANLIEDPQILENLYIRLTKPESNQNGDHWISATFANLPMVSMINQFSLLQNEILAARSMAIAHISSKGSFCGNYIFDQIKVTVLGPDVSRKNEEVKIKVFLAAHDFFIEPEITVNSGEVIETKEGITTVKVKIQGKKEMILKGTVSYKLPDGDVNVIPWEKTIRIED